MPSRFVLPLVAILALGASPALSQSKDQQGKPCPPGSSATVGSGGGTATKGNPASLPAEHKGVEHSAVLPDAGGEGKSKAPTIPDTAANTNVGGCPNEPNRLDTPK
jgi:hypothetical protein